MRHWVPEYVLPTAAIGDMMAPRIELIPGTSFPFGARSKRCQARVLSRHGTRHVTRPLLGNTVHESHRDARATI